MANRTPQLRKGLSREDLIKGTWHAHMERYNPDPIEKEALKAFDLVLDHLIAHVNEGGVVTRKSVTSFFGYLELLTKCRSVITDRMGKGEMVPDVLDRLAAEGG